MPRVRATRLGVRWALAVFLLAVGGLLLWTGVCGRVVSVPGRSPEEGPATAPRTAAEEALQLSGRREERAAMDPGGETGGRMPAPEPIAEIAGVVVDAAGAAIRDAEVVLSRESQDAAALFALPALRVTGLPGIFQETLVVGRATTDREGRFRIGGLIPNDELRCVIRASGRWTDVRTVHASERAAPLRIALGPEQRIAGSVRDGAGRAVAGAHVAVGAAKEGWLEGASLRTRSDAHGWFRVEGFPQGVPVVVAAWREGGPAAVHQVEIGGEPEVDLESLTLVLSDGVSFPVRVLEEESGDPLPNVAVCVQRVDEPGRETWHVSCGVTDTEGRVVVARTRAGPWSARLAHEDLLERGLTVPDDVVRSGDEWTVRVSRGVVVVGRVVTSDGRPVEGVEGRLEPFTHVVARSSPDGRFRLAPVPVRGAALTLVAEGYPRHRLTLGPFRPGTAPNLGDVVLRRGVRVTVRVLDPDRRPLPESWIEWVQPGGASAGHTVLETGTRDLRQLLPGPVRVTAGSDRFRTRVQEFELVGEGVAQTLDVQLEPGLAIVGILLDIEGNPVDEAVVTMRDRATESDAAGRFRFEGLSEGTYRLRVSDGVHHWAGVEVEAGGRPLTIQAARVLGPRER